MNFSNLLSVLESIEGQETFLTDVSLAGLVQYLNNNGRYKDYLARINDYLRNHPDLNTANDHWTKQPEGKELLELVLGLFLPQIREKEELGMIFRPFSSDLIYSTQPEVSETQGQLEFTIRPSVGEVSTFQKKRACHLVLAQVYGLHLPYDLPEMVLRKINKESAVESIFELEWHDFVVVETLEKPKELAEETINYICTKPEDTDYLLANISLDKFRFSGLDLVITRERTKEKLLSELRSVLLYRSTFINESITSFVQGKIRSFLELPKIRLTLHQYSPELLGDSIASMFIEELRASILYRSIQKKTPLLIEDFSVQASYSLIDQGILMKGARSLIMFPVFAEDEKPIGIIELAYPDPRIFNESIVQELEEIFWILSHHLRMFQQRRERDIHQIIQTYFLTIHPSVQWKFREASVRIFARQKKGTLHKLGVPPVLFQNVYPLYGQADIVGSSRIRNEAIYTDLTHNLNLVISTLKNIPLQTDDELREKLIYKAEQLLAKSQAAFRSDFESKVLDYLIKQVHHYLRNLESSELVLSSRQEYFSSIEPSLGFVYQKRKAFEDSVMQLNQALSELVEAEDQQQQTVLSHYFEKYTTDGLEFNIYLGQSLLEDGHFPLSILKSFRQWQLVLMCKITREVASLQQKTPVKLQTAQLVFWYSETLDIRFRIDEKQFDVDGAYNVRYEILKKRIDKALIKGTNERLTLSGKIAIVYLHSNDRKDMVVPLQFLVESGYIDPEIEDLSLVGMQGAQGLQAVRITVKV